MSYEKFSDFFVLFYFVFNRLSIVKLKCDQTAIQPFFKALGESVQLEYVSLASTIFINYKNKITECFLIVLK